MIHTRCVISRYRHVQCLSVGNRCRLQSRSSNILLYEMEDSSDTMVENEFKLCNSEVKNESDDFPKKNEKQLKLLKVMATDDSMSDDVFETEDTLKTPAARPQPQPSPTGYRGYKPPVELFQEQDHDQEPPHKTILLGDSGVGKTSLLVRFDTGQFQTGTFSATVGIGFTVGS